ncbi:MAG: PGF-pre-PGF domain-containing protein, partial [Candidatus Aenigmatarchaeota archaeon]
LIPNLSVGENTSVILTLSGSKGTYSGYLVASSEGLLENKSVPVSVEITSVPQDDPPGGGGGGGGGTDPYQVKHSFFELSSGKTNEIDIDGKYVPLTKVEFQVKEGTGKVTFEFKGLDVRPSGTPEPPGDVDRYFTVTMTGTDDSNFQDVEVHFKVNKSWMEESGFNSASLARYSDGAWEAFPGTKTGGDGTYLYYKATVPGFSLFAVTGEQVSEAPEAPKRTGRQKVNRTEVGWNCTPNVLECSGDILYECSSDGMGWEEEVCEHGCSEGACRPGPGLTGMVTGADPSLLMAVIGIVIAAAAVLVVFRLRAK